MKKCSNF